MEILTSVKRLYISFKSLVNEFVYSFGRAALLLLVEVQNHTVPVRERGRIRVIVIRLWASVPDRDKGVFVFSRTPKLVLEPTQPPLQWVPEILSLGLIHWAMMLANHFPSSAKVKNEWSYTSTLPVFLHCVCRDNFAFGSMLSPYPPLIKPIYPH